MNRSLRKEGRKEGRKPRKKKGRKPRKEAKEGNQGRKPRKEGRGRTFEKSSTAFSSSPILSSEIPLRSNRR